MWQRGLGLLLILISFNSFASRLPETLATPGGVVVIEVDSKTESAQFIERPILLKKTADATYAIIGVPLTVNPGKYSLKAKHNDGTESIYKFRVKKKDYPAQYITITNKRKVNPNKEDENRIWAELQRIRKAIATRSDREPAVDFVLPATGRFSSHFGLKRFFNKQPRNPHKGLDIAAPTGTPITAPAPGKVVEVGDDFFYSGNVVYVDHGRGLVSMYAHMNEIDVKLGQELKTGDLIGKIGMTGRVTGPHLHWSVYLNKTAVDPNLFLVEKDRAPGWNDLDEKKAQ